MILIQYYKHVHDLRFQNQEFWISTQRECYELIFTVNQILVLKQNDHLCIVDHSFIHKVLVQHN